MTSASLLSRRIDKIHGRLSNLYRHASASPSPSPDLLPTALIELGVLFETLQFMMKEIYNQNELLQNLQAGIEVERCQFQFLADLALQGHLIVNENLQIQSINSAAKTLLNLSRNMTGQSLLALVVENQAFLQGKLTQLNLHERVEVLVHFWRDPDTILAVSVIAQRGQDWHSQKPLFYLFFKDSIECEHPSLSVDQAGKDGNSPLIDYPIQTYCKGDYIPLEHKKIWLVTQGIVKLTAFSEQGEEMLLGLLGRSTVFGPSLTTLPTYQATVLEKTQLVSLPVADIFQSFELSQIILPLLTYRLQQAERFLSIYGQMRIEDRFVQLLRLLKQEIGEPVEEGVRLTVRLTHQDLASACGTTRVTITRLLGKFQQVGKVKVDAQNHLILIPDDSRKDNS
jgi:CRP-like cAMP-binding protein